MNRIADLAQSHRIGSLILAAQSRVHENQIAVSSGKAARRFSEIARDATLLVGAKDARARLERHVKDNELVIGRLQVADGALEDLARLAERLRTLLIQRLNGGGESLPLDVEAGQMLAEAVNELNAAFDGRHLFAGSRTDAPPVALDGPITEADPALYYRGDSVTLSVQADTGLQIAYGITADRPAFAELLAALGNAAAGHAGNGRDQLNAALEQAGRALDGTADLRGENGAVMRRIEAVNDGHRGTLLYFDETVSRIEDADLPAAMTRLVRDQTALEAAFTVVGRLSALSLADFLR